MTLTTLKIEQIRTDGGTQPRVTLNDETVEDYTDEMQSGTIFPAVDVFYDGTHYWLVDGFHRIEAAKRCGFSQFSVKVFQGNLRDAVWYSCGCNTKHGLRRTRADNRQAVERVLRDEEWSKLSNRDIAAHCQVNRHFVMKIREELSGHISHITVTRGGSTYTQKSHHLDYVTKHSPAEIKTRVEAGEWSVKDAYDATRAVEQVSEPVREMALTHGVKDGEVIKAFQGREKTDTFATVLRTGALQGGEVVIPINKATVRDVEQVFSEAHQEHRNGGLSEPIFSGIVSVAYKSPDGEIALKFTPDVVDKFVGKVRVVVYEVQA